MSRSRKVDDADEFKDKLAPGIVQPHAFPGQAETLAWRTADCKRGPEWFEMRNLKYRGGRNFIDIAFEHWHAGKVLPQRLAARRVALDHHGSLKT